jgi:glycosyltransferase involved in cell wall biosynthesis
VWLTLGAANLGRIEQFSAAAVEKSRAFSIILPVMNETWSLEETVRVLIDENPGDIKEILIIISRRTNEVSLRTADSLVTTHPMLIRVHQQKLPYLGGAIQEAFSLARGNYTVLMASDLETDPHLVRLMIEEIRDGKYDIVVASRWLQNRGFQGYSLPKYVANFIFQKIFSTLYRTPLTDLTYGFRIYRTKVIKHIIWKELKHSFLFESLVKPLRLGCHVKEIPAIWTPRKEGDSQNMLSAYVGYFRIGLRVAFTNPKRFLKDKCESGIDGEMTSCT